jgi:hypothetical protein
MKCRACDVILSEREDARKFVASGARVELCNGCAKWVDLPMVGGDDVISEELPEEPEEEDGFTHIST